MSACPESSSNRGPINGSVPTAAAIAYESATPMVPPAIMINRVSARNCSLMCRFLAPSARRSLISRILSSTDTSMIFITPTPPIPRVRVPIKVSRTCNPIVNASITGRNSSRQNLRHGFLLELGRDWLKHHHCGVSRVPQITRRGVRNPRRLVIAAEVIAELDLARHHSDHSKAHPAHKHCFSHCWTPAEELFLETATQKDHAPPLQFVLRINPASFRRHFVPHLTVLRANSAHRCRSHHAVTIGNPGPPYGFQTRMLHQRSCLLHHLQVSLLKKNFLARALPTRLLAGLLRPADHHTFAKGIKPVHQNAAEAASVGDQQGDGGNPPNDPQHGQQTARKVPLQRDPSFENDLK